jgi:tRNA dimethylallyltransferase
MGPTAAGKTALAVRLVERLHAEIVSVDSAMVYRGMDIGTTKPDAATQAVAPHALIDIRDPEQPYSAGQFRADAINEIQRIRAAGRLPLLTGGTGLYFRALAQGLSALPGRDDALRAQIAAQAQAVGWPALHARLQTLDAATAARVHPNDAQRIARALEIHALTGLAPSAVHATQGDPGLPWSLAQVIITPSSRAQLYENIENRFKEMIAAGFVAEVEKLRRRPELNLSTPAMRAVGYRQLWQALAGAFSLETGIARALTASRQLARRQLTWLRSFEAARWFDSDTKNLAKQVEKALYNWYGR